MRHPWVRLITFILRLTTALILLLLTAVKSYIVGAGLATKVSFSPITKQQNPPLFNCSGVAWYTYFDRLDWVRSEGIGS
ncbi:hypothetical protein [Coleofasciculus sp. G2-EDA-02]|uniref:hypothetical protein n=1 Tax=Coleofasciculus sp. G2-EDA-02 TaxID=3069529 RepID=UPI0040644C6B